MTETLSLGGRDFERIQDGPVRQDLFVLQHARHAGLVDAEAAKGEEPDAFAARLLGQVLGSGRAMLLLGGLLIPKGKKATEWTEEMAFETAGHLGGITGADAKAAVYQELASALLGFFLRGLGSWIASRRSSGNAGESDSPATTTATDTGNGAASCEPLPTTTSIAASA